MVVAPAVEAPDQSLSFLWVELTELCNLECIHCYAESGPFRLAPGGLTTDDYKEVIRSAAGLGCRRIQFIGGEPTLHPDLPRLIAHARSLDYEFVEVYTNATRISDALLDCFVEHQVNIAVSFYSDIPVIHDLVTSRPGSHAATLSNVKQLIAANLTVRAGIVSMAANAEGAERTAAFLRDLGIENVGIDRVRGVGRGADLVSDTSSSITELCGSCWRGSLCVTPNGAVYSCIMAKQWPVGSIRDQTLENILDSDALVNIRNRVYSEVWLPWENQAEQGRVEGACQPNCGPSCPPYGPCPPTCSPSCPPCFPWGRCAPQVMPCPPNGR